MARVERRHCPRCDRDKPQTRGYFYWRSDIGWDSWCKECRKEFTRLENEARTAADFRRRAGLPLTADEERLARAKQNQRRAQREYMKRKRARMTEEARVEERRKAKEWRDANREVVREKARIDYYKRHGDVRKYAIASDHRNYKRHLTKAERELPVEPFAKWIEETFGAMAKVEAPVYLGISVREIEHVVNREAKTITLPIVDRAFVNFGRPDLLNSLYPLEATA